VKTTLNNKQININNMKNEVTKKDVYQIVTERIIEQLNQGVIPWHKSWRTDSTALSNFVSKKAYKGMNSILLNCGQFKAPYFLTYKQAKELGGNVKAGEKGLPIIFWSFVESKTETDFNGKPKQIGFLRYYTVFNIEQTEGIKWSMPELPENKFNPIEQAETVASNMPEAPKVLFGGNRAFYSPALDFVQMPLKQSFETNEAYYSVLFHELAHSTGHSKRLDRGVEKNAGFGSESYSKEELIAEMTSAFVCSSIGLESRIPDNASYISSWIKALKGDSKLVVLASGKAQKAADWILGNLETESVE
jgi:antirestriction protein ArdC